MSPQQTAQIRARLEQVAKERAAQTTPRVLNGIKLLPATPEAVTAYSKALASTLKQGERSAKVLPKVLDELEKVGAITRGKVTKAAATLKANEAPVTNAKAPVTNAAARAAKHKAKNPEAVRAKNRAAKAASRAKAKGAT